MTIQTTPSVETPTEILCDLHWMARRYADGRSSYAPGAFNRITDWLLANGVNLNDCDGTLYAKDGMFGEWQNGTFIQKGTRQ